MEFATNMGGLQLEIAGEKSAISLLHKRRLGVTNDIVGCPVPTHVNYSRSISSTVVRATLVESGARTIDHACLEEEFDDNVYTLVLMLCKIEFILPGERRDDGIQLPRFASFHCRL